MAITYGTLSNVSPTSLRSLRDVSSAETPDGDSFERKIPRVRASAIDRQRDEEAGRQKAWLYSGLIIAVHVESQTYSRSVQLPL